MTTREAPPMSLHGASVFGIDTYKHTTWPSSSTGSAATRAACRHLPMTPAQQSFSPGPPYDCSDRRTSWCAQQRSGRRAAPSRAVTARSRSSPLTSPRSTRSANAACRSARTASWRDTCRRPASRTTERTASRCRSRGRWRQRVRRDRHKPQRDREGDGHRPLQPAGVLRALAPHRRHGHEPEDDREPALLHAAPFLRPEVISHAASPMRCTTLPTANTTPARETRVDASGSATVWDLPGATLRNERGSPSAAQ